MELKGKKVIVTGGANGIGKSLAEKLAGEGAVVGVFDIDKKGLDALREHNINIYCAVCDVSNYRDVESAVNDFYDNFKGIDILVNNAAFIYNCALINLVAGAVKKHDIAMWDKVISTDLNSVFYMAVNVVEKMILNRTKGVIVNISSVCASGNPGQCAYSAAKAGVNALTATWAKELGPLGIRIVGVAPGYTETETTMRLMSENMLKSYVRKIPLQRLGRPEEIAEGVISVIKNDFFNGKVFELDGGLVI